MYLIVCHWNLMPAHLFVATTVITWMRKPINTRNAIFMRKPSLLIEILLLYTHYNMAIYQKIMLWKRGSGRVPVCEWREVNGKNHTPVPNCINECFLLHWAVAGIKMGRPEPNTQSHVCECVLMLEVLESKTNKSMRDKVTWSLSHSMKLSRP